MKKKFFYTEAAYIFGLIFLAVGTAFMERTDFGVSMVVAPAYILHLKISEFLPFFSFGMAEYTLQAVIILILILIMKKVKLSYLLSFVTAVIYGILLDGAMALVELVPFESTAVNAVFFISGMLCCSLGVAFLFQTYISPEAYELFVKELSAKYSVNITKFKTAYDCTSCLIAVLLSFVFFGFGHFEGVKLGTVICAFANGSLIGLFSKLLNKVLDFKDGLPAFKRIF